ncbi:MAG: hypothetical protein JKY56_27840 [Kofleriaceae bacterium]|nr:hypothetical protein [Kofleriaceae bacterium]
MEFKLTKTVVIVGALVSGLAGCVGDAPQFVNPPAPDAAVELDERGLVRQQFEDNVVPLLTGYCAACHGEGGTGGGFMGGSDMYKTVLEWPNLISLRVPSASSLLSKGAHAGPAWQVDQKEIVRAWVQEESNLAPELEDTLETDPIIPVSGENSIDLSDVGLPGATITFRMEPLSSGMYLSRMSLNAGSQGIHIVHPTFVPWEGDSPAPDPVDRFSNVDIYAAALASESVGGGTLILVNTSSSAPISIRFTVAEEADAGQVILAGCEDVPSFTANAQPMLAQYCTSCHGGSDNGATNATDMTQLLDLSPTAQEAACGQILSRVNLLDSINSSIFLAAEPQSSLGHSFKLPDNATFLGFRDALTIWIAAEQAAISGN